MPHRKLSQAAKGFGAYRSASPGDEMSLLLSSLDPREVALERAALHQSLQRDPSATEVLWGIHRRHMLRHAQAGDWQLYRDTRVAMACLLEDQGRSEEALDIYLEVAYLDANGPKNAGTCFGRDHGLADCFDPGRAAILPAIVLAIAALAEEVGLTHGQLRDRHLMVAETARRNFRTPMSVQDAWSCLSKAMAV